MRDSSASNWGVSDIPMQLLIGACIISFAVPIVYSAYDDLSSRMTEASIEREIKEIMEKMEILLSADHGSRSTMNLDLDGFGTVSLESLKIGGALGYDPNRFLISYSLTDGTGGKITLDPPYPMTSIDNSTLELSSGTYELVITNVGSQFEDHLLVQIE